MDSGAVAEAVAAHKVRRALRARKVHRGHKVAKARKGLQEVKGHKVRKAFKGRRERKVYRVPVRKVRRALKAHRAHKAQLVLAELAKVHILLGHPPELLEGITSPPIFPWSPTIMERRGTNTGEAGKPSA